MAISFVATGSQFSSTSSGTNITLNKPAGVQDGDLLIAYVMTIGEETNIDIPTGWLLKRSIVHTKPGTDQAGSASLFILARDGLASDPTSWSISVTDTVTRRSARVVAYRGTASAINQFLNDDVATDNSTGGFTRPTPTVSNSSPGAWRLGFFFAKDNAASIGTPNWHSPSPSATKRFDDHVSFSNPCMTGALFCSNGPVSTGSQQQSATWTTDGAGITMNFSITWIGLIRPLGEGPAPKASYQVLLDPHAAEDSTLDLDEDQDTGIDIIGIEEDAFVDLVVEDGETLQFSESAQEVISDFDVFFNNSLTNPGFVIRLSGLLESDQQFETIEVFRRDTSGRYRDQRVRGLANVLVVENEMEVTDYEAPINTPLEYHLRLITTDNEVFDFGPRHPRPQPYIPVLHEAYGGGAAFLKVIDSPQRSIPLLIENLSRWTRRGRVHGKYDVLGRQNPVVITDVLGGKEGTFTAHCFLKYGQSVDVIEQAFATGNTMLLQNHNPTKAAFKDSYIKIESVDFERHSHVGYEGELGNPLVPDVDLTITVQYVEVDRPSPEGVVVLEVTWDVVNLTHLSWGHVLNVYEDWHGVFVNPFGSDNITKVYTSSQLFVVPQDVTEITVECWGPGASGRTAASTSAAGRGGGGGAYARSTISVTPGQPFNMIIPGGQAPVAENSIHAGNTIFGANVVVAHGGTSGSLTAGGQGGSAGSSVGDTTFSGGNGGNREAAEGAGGGGGGAAGPNGAGSNGSAGSSGIGGAGGAGNDPGGAGGAGGNQNAGGSPGTAPGGAGGGRGSDGGNAGHGARGEIRVTYAS